MQAGYEIDVLFKEAKSRWLKPEEVLFVLQNHEKFGLTEAPPQKPPSGSLFLFNTRILDFFREDGHIWRKMKNTRIVSEAHERLETADGVGLDCYYAFGKQNPNFQRRVYSMAAYLYGHLVLVHYRDVSLTKASITKVDLEWIFPITNFVLELPSAVFDQLSSVRKPQPFCDFKDIIGPVCALCQCIFAAVTYGFAHQHADSPIKVSFWPIVFASGLLLSKHLAK
ncbi:hypothetical protein AB3S75_023444 [Citrus x aurantiifolia]